MASDQDRRNSFVGRPKTLNVQKIPNRVFGSDSGGNILLVGTRVQGDTMARPFIAAQGSSAIQTMMQQGYANVGVIVDLSNLTDPYTYLGER